VPDDNLSDTDASPAASGVPRLVLKPREERRLQAGHLWIFSNEVDVAATPLGGFTPGQVAAVVSSRGRFLGYASVNPHTLIAGRVMGRGPAERPCVSASTNGRSTGWPSASLTCCPAWWWTATATPAWLSSALRAWRR
jgi:hypothetical protein